MHFFLKDFLETPSVQLRVKWTPPGLILATASFILLTGRYCVLSLLASLALPCTKKPLKAVWICAWHSVEARQVSTDLKG